MPQFNPGQSTTAKVPVTVQPSGLSCEVELFLGPNDTTKVVSSGRMSFVSIGSQQQINLPVVMPSALGTYHVYIDLYVGGSYFAGYTGTEDAVIQQLSTAFNMAITSIVPGSIHGVTMRAFDVTCHISNPNSVPVTHNLQMRWEWAVAVVDSNNPGSYRFRRWWNFALADDYVYPVTLNPGQSVDIVALKEDYYAPDDMWYGNAPYNMLNEGREVKIYFIIVDEIGNHSPGASYGTYVG